MQQNLSVFQKNKTITALKNKSGKNVTTDKDISITPQTFYEEMYNDAQINKPEQDNCQTIMIRKYQTIGTSYKIILQREKSATS